jgi:hypothetical protein
MSRFLHTARVNQDLSRFSMSGNWEEIDPIMSCDCRTLNLAPRPFGRSSTTVWDEFFEKSSRSSSIHMTVWHEFDDRLVQSPTIHLSTFGQFKTDLATSRYRCWFLVADNHKSEQSKRSAMLPYHKSSLTLIFLSPTDLPRPATFLCHDLDPKWHYQPLYGDITNHYRGSFWLGMSDLYFHLPDVSDLAAR